MSKGHKFTNIPEIPNASPTSSSPARHPLVRPQPAPRNQHRALKRPSLLTIAPPRLSEKSRRELKSMYSTTGATTNFQSSLGTLLLLRQSPPTPALVRKTALPAHDRPPTPALVRKTALPAHDSLRHQHWCAKTALPAHDSPPTPAASAISKMQPSVRECEQPWKPTDSP